MFSFILPIAVVGNGAGLVMSTLDMLSDNGGKPACFLDTDDKQSEERVRNILNKQYGESEVAKNSGASISRALGINMEKGFHYYFMKDEKLVFEKQKEQYKGGTLGDMDILGAGGKDSGFIIEYIDNELPSEGRVMVMKNDVLERLTERKHQQGKEKPDSEKNGDETGEFIEELEEKYRDIEVWYKWAELMPNTEENTRDEWLSVAKFFYKYLFYQ